jgi:hypothetical protein
MQPLAIEIKRSQIICPKLPNELMPAVTALKDAPDVSADSYLVVGLATCYLKEDGEVHEVTIIEPIPSAALEALLKGIPTSYSLAMGTTLGQLIGEETLQRPAEFPENAQFCDDFAARAIAAARTYLSRQEAQSHIPVGTSTNNLNYSTERKRVLNQTRVIRKEDDIKQHEYTHRVL